MTRVRHSGGSTAVALRCLPVLVLAVACSSDAGPAGNWRDTGGKSTLTLHADTTFTMDTSKGQHVTGTWKLDGSSVVMTGKEGDGPAMTVRAAFDGDTLRVQFGPTVTVYERQ